MDTLADVMGLPPEEVALIAAENEALERQELEAIEAEEELKLAAFGKVVQDMVDEAVEARDASGIESRWLEDLKQYYGSDWSVTTGTVVDRADQRGEKTETKERQPKSKIVVNITRPKTNAAMARLADMLLPTDDKNWGISPTPNPDLTADTTDTETVMTAAGVPMQNPDGTPLTKAQVARKLLDQARKSADGMERTIHDQLVECNYNGEFRKGLRDLTILGTMIMRGPFVRSVERRKWVKGPQGWEMQRQTREVPASERVNPWNYYPDPSCGGDIRNARYHVERADYNSKTLKRLRGQPGYIDSQINLCLHEGPKSHKDRGARDRRHVDGEYYFRDDLVYDVFMVHGEFEKGQLADAGVAECVCEDEDDRLTSVTGCVFLCNGRVIKAYLNPLDTDDLPYDVARYEEIDGQVFGVGVPFVLRNPSRVVIAGWRMTMDNSALSGGLQAVVNRKLVDPADGSWKITGTKTWIAKDGTDDVNKVFAIHQVESRVNETLAVIDRALRFSEDESSMPAIMEGSQAQAPDKVGVANLLSNSSNTVLRRLVKGIDDNITDHHITRYYDWNMQYSEDESIKGDFSVDARGTSVLMVRDGQKQSLLQVGKFVLHPMLGKFHKRSGFDWLKAMYESHHLDSSSILVDEDEVEVILKQAAEQKPSPPPQVLVAEKRAEVETAKLSATVQDAERERQFDMQKLDKQLQFEMMKYANENKVSLGQVQSDMMKLLVMQRDAESERQHKERMQQRELDIKSRLGTGI